MEFLSNSCAYRRTTLQFRILLKKFVRILTKVIKKIIKKTIKKINNKNMKKTFFDNYENH